MENRRARIALGPLIVLLLVAPSVSSVAAVALQGGAGDTFVVGFDGAVPTDVGPVMAGYGGTVLDVLERSDAVRVHADDAAAFEASVSGLPGVRFVEPTVGVQAQKIATDDMFVAYECCLIDGGGGGGGGGGGYYYYDYDSDETLDETGSPQTTVAVVDSGIDANHPNLTDNLWEHPVNGTAGWDFVDDDAQPEDRFGHGTHVSGIIANLTPSASIMALRVMDENGTGRVSDVAEAVHFAADHSADVIVLSLGWARLPAYPAQQLRDAIDAARAEGANVVASAGNGGSVHAPASFDNVVAVTGLNAVEENNETAFEVASWASHGPEVDLAAAANGAVSTISDTHNMQWCGENATTCSMTGTSVAAAPVAAAMAFMKACRPTLTATQIEEILFRTATDVTQGAATLGPDEATGYGNLNLPAAVQHLLGCRQPAAGISDDGGIGRVLWEADETEAVARDGWTSTTDRSFSKDGAAWHVGISNTTPERNVLTTPFIYVPDRNVELSFARWEDTEPSSNHTLRQVQVSSNGHDWTSIYKSIGEAPETWIRERIRLPDSLEGSSVQARFVFEPNQTRLAEHEGWFVDDIRLYTTGYSDPPTESTYEYGTVEEGNCTSFQVQVTAPGGLEPGETKAVDFELTETGGEADLRVLSPRGGRTGSWACGDNAVRNEIPGAAYSGPEADTEWVRVAPPNSSGNWTVIVNGYSGSTDWDVTVTEHIVRDDPSQTVPYGADTHLDTPDAAYPAMNCTGDGSGCTYDSSTDYSVWADANDSGEHWSEAGTGYAYRLAEACQAQTQDGVVQLHPDADYTFNHETSDTGQYENSIRVRPGGLDGEHTLYAVDASSSFTQAQTPTYTPDFWNSYEHVVSAYAWAKTSLSLEDAYARTAIQLHGLDVVFGDTAAPVLEATTTSLDDAPAGATGGFMGWYQEPVTVSVDVFDPPGGEADARSCLDRITIQHSEANAPPAEVFVPGYYQPATAADADATTYDRTYDGDQRYDLVIDAWDGNGTHANDTVAFWFGVDLNAPSATHAIDPSLPTGENGWYARNASHPNNGRPTLTVECDDPGAQGSGCQTSTVVVDEDEITYSASYWADPGQVLTNGNHTITYNSTDVAGNTGPGRGPLDVRVDVELPSVNLTPNAQPGPDPDWYAQELAVAATCIEQVSGCAQAQATLDGTPYAMGTFNVTGEGEHVVNWTAEDVAGNNDTGTRAFNIDLQAPNGTSILVPEDGWLTSTNVLEITWEAASDAGPAGLSHYQVFLDGDLHSTTAETWATVQDISEGSHCVTVRAVDLAGNVGPAASEHCVDVDHTAPSISFDMPGDEYLINGSGYWDYIPNVASGQAWVIPRDLTFETSATDGGPAELASITIENGTSDPSPVTCNASPCTRFFDNELTEPWREYPITVRAEDTAGNVLARQIDVRHTALHAYTDFDHGPDEWYGILDWRPYTQADFQEYRLYRDTDSTFDALGTEQIATITEPGQVRYRDQPLDTSTDYYYWVEYVTTDGEVLRSYWWHTETGSYDGSGGGGGGGGGSCDRDDLLGSCMRWKMQAK